MKKEEKTEMLKKIARVMSKDEEKALLLTIENLLDSADPDGYVAAAFRGCVDLARRNIANDFCESFEENLRLTQEYLIKQNSELFEAEEKLDDMQETINALQKEYEDVTDRLQERNTIVEGQAKTIENLNLEILKLKSKIYDLSL